VIGNEWGGCGWCGTNDLGPLDSREAEERRVQLQKHLGRPLRTTDLDGHSLPSDQSETPRVERRGARNGEPEWRRAPDGRIWQLERGPAFKNHRDEPVVIASVGWEQDGQVKRDLHIAEADWLAWDLVWEGDDHVA
jgi:hypothetical protein